MKVSLHLNNFALFNPDCNKSEQTNTSNFKSNYKQKESLDLNKHPNNIAFSGLKERFDNWLRKNGYRPPEERRRSQMAYFLWLHKEVCNNTNPENKSEVEKYILNNLEHVMVDHGIDGDDFDMQNRYLSIAMFADGDLACRNIYGAIRNALRKKYDGHLRPTDLEVTQDIVKKFPEIWHLETAVRDFGQNDSKGGFDSFRRRSFEETKYGNGWDG